MKKLLMVFGLSVLCASFLAISAQDLKMEVYEKEHIPNKEPVPYKYTREADVMWSKVIYRIVDLREKANMPLYYPVEPIGNRRSLIDVILLGIDEHGLQAYDPNDPLNEFADPLQPDAINRAMGMDTSEVQVQMPDGSYTTEIAVIPRKPYEVKQYLVKEKWFFDRNYSTMMVRTIGLCPIRVYNRLDDNGMPTEEIVRKQCFWIYFPESRRILSQHEVFNRHNDAQRISFDDIFWQRRYTSVIVRESNMYNNRYLFTYTNGLGLLYESEKIKDWLFKIEHDLWEY